MASTNTHDLIAAIYAATLSPQDFERNFDRLDTLLSFDEDGTAASERRDSRVDDAALPHVEIARSIQGRIGLARTRDQKVSTILESVPNPSFLVARSEKVVASNAPALARHPRLPATLADCIADADVRRQIRDFFRQNSDTLLAIAGHADPRQKAQTSVLVKRVDAGLVGGAASDLFLVSIVDFGFDEETMEVFRAAYGMTRAESQVAVLLASGLQPPDIAKQREVSLDTIRTQIKVIKHKTSVRDIPALVRLLCGFSAGVLAPTAGRGEASVPQSKSAPLKARREFILKDGRRVDYLEQGHADGRPVLLFHNLPYGAELPEAAIRHAHAERLRFIAPFRPGFGRSDAVEHLAMDARVTQVAEDSRELLTHLGIGDTVVVSHAMGAAFALRLARLYPGSISRLIGVSRPPAWRDEWMGQTPQRQRFMLRLAKHLPQMLPVVAWAMVACMDSAYATEFVRYNCKDGEADAAAVQNQETVDLIAKGSVEALRNGLEAFSGECRLALVDFTDEARATPHKFLLIHGDDDRIIGLSQATTFADAVPGTELEIVPGAGQLLFYSHWQAVMHAVQDSVAMTSVQPAA